MDARLEACVEDARELSRALLAFLDDHARSAQAGWVARSVEAGRVIFQPWVMEILFVLAVAREARFTELQRLLGGVSSRTLSDKLQVLRDRGLVDRRVFDEQPVRIEYRLTRDGRTVAALATPLFTHMNVRDAADATVSDASANTPK